MPPLGIQLARTESRRVREGARLAFEAEAELALESRQLQLELTPRVSWGGSDDELLDMKQAAALLTVQPSTLRYWAREARVVCIRLGLRETRWSGRCCGIRDSRFDPGKSESLAAASRTAQVG